MRLSRYIHHFSYYPRTADRREWVGHINREIAKFHIDIIMPVSQFGFETLAEHADLLDARQKLVPLTSWKNFSIANNKGKLSGHLVEHSLSAPYSLLTGINPSTRMRWISLYHGSSNPRLMRRGEMGS